MVIDFDNITLFFSCRFDSYGDIFSIDGAPLWKGHNTLVYMDVGSGLFYGVSSDNSLHYSTLPSKAVIESGGGGISMQQIAGAQMSWVSVSPSGSVWSIDTSGNLGHFTGSNNTNIATGFYFFFFFIFID